MKKFLRWPTWLILAALVLAALVPTLPFFHSAQQKAAHAAHFGTSPTLSISPAIVKPYQTVSVTAQGFAPYDTVSLQLDSNNNFIFASIYCDSNGNCSGPAQMPYNGMVQGQHTVIGTGKNGAVADATVIFVPNMFLYGPNQGQKGGPGTPIQIDGAAFNANETVQIVWGKNQGISEGSATTDASGNLSFSFNAPTGIAPGIYAVIAARSNQKPANVAAPFKILRPQMISTAGIRGNQPVNVSVTGFQASEQVTVSWSANGGQQLATFMTDNTGAGGTQFTPPPAPHGSYILTATGGSSGLHAKNSLHVGPGIMLIPGGYELPGATVTVSGGGFTPGETVNIHIQHHDSHIVSAVVDPTGDFSAPITLPTTYKPPNNYFFVYADNTAGHEHAETAFVFTDVWFGSFDCCPNYGSPITFTGQGYMPQETVNIYWNYQQTGQLKAGSTTVANDGTFSITLNVPSDPNLVRVQVAAIGAITRLKFVTSVIEHAALILRPPSGHAGTKLHIDGGGFDAAEAVAVTFNGINIGTVTTNASGAFALTYTVPATKGAGNATIQAIGGTSGLSISSTFGYIPSLKISPTTGPSGTIITVTGHHFSASYGMQIWWYDPTTESKTYLATIWTSSQGDFTGTVTAPSGLTGGNTYYVQVVDNITQLTTQVPFVAQMPCTQCIYLSPNIANPGATISVQGSNFTPGETVNVYFQQPGNGIVSATVDGSGAFTVPLTVPTTYQKGVNYYVYAVNTSGTEQASTQFLFTQPTLWPENPYGGYYFNAPTGFGGGGFAAHETVNFFWHYPQLGDVKAGTTTAASDGSINATVIIPSISYKETINLVAIGAISKVKATTPVSEFAGIFTDPSQGHRGTMVHITAGGLASTEQVTITFDGSIIATVTTNTKGGFTTAFKIPSSAQLGSSLIEAVGNSSGLTLDAYFPIIPTMEISPSTGPSGTPITVTGRYFDASTTLQIWWFDPNTYTTSLLGSVTTTSRGTLKTTITAPSGLISGNTYYVQIYDPSRGYVEVQAVFVAQ